MKYKIYNYLLYYNLFNFYITFNEMLSFRKSINNIFLLFNKY